MKKLSIIIILLTSSLLYSNAQENSEIFTIYLVRHAEKGVSNTDPGNPPLSDCGEKRAENLVTILKEVNIDNIYSTSYIRTESTAKPCAEDKDLSIESYDPQRLKEFSIYLLSLKKDALVVGHSNTTSVLAGMLAGEKLIPFDEAIYDRIYQVVIFGDQSRILILNQGFQCDN